MTTVSYIVFAGGGDLMGICNCCGEQLAAKGLATASRSHESDLGFQVVVYRIAAGLTLDDLKAAITHPELRHAKTEGQS